MPETNFIQIHSLHSYTSALLNRDDSGLAKRISYGGHTRTRISSQCLKRHWRTTEDDNALQKIDGATTAVRSREIVTRKVVNVLKQENYHEEVVKVVGDQLQLAVYGDKGNQRASRQPLLLGKPEIDYLLNEARNLAAGYANDPEGAQTAAKEWGKKASANLKEMRNATKLPGGACRRIVRAYGNCRPRGESRCIHSRSARVHRP